jgi:serine/threonine protein kinase
MKLLSPDPTRRPTAEEALAHPFLSEKNPTPLVKPFVSEPVPSELKRISSSIAKESQLSPTRRHVRMDAWATLVDYIVEIVEVFDLTSTAAFRAMHYFDRFFSSYHASVSLLFCVLSGTMIHVDTHNSTTTGVLYKSQVPACRRDMPLYCQQMRRD